MTAKPDWDAAQYLRFEDERTRPPADLLARVPLSEPRRCIDLGCGPGNSTELVAARFPGAVNEGLDSSPDMLEKARKRLPNLSFVLGDVNTWSDAAGYDLIFANAVLQWLPDHQGLFPRLARSLAHLLEIVETRLELFGADIELQAERLRRVAVLLLAGFVVLALSRLGLTGFRLPGDILIRRENFTFFFPITTMLLISLVLTLLFNLLGRR